MNLNYFLASSGPLLAKILVMGIASVIIPYLISSYINRKENKKIKIKNRFNNDQNKIALKISELGMMKKNGILKNDEYEEKLKVFEEEKLNHKIEYYLKQNKKHIMLQNAFDKKFIDEQQYKTKLEAIKSEIKSNIK